jgi:hypothetical protein
MPIALNSRQRTRIRAAQLRGNHSGMLTARKRSRRGQDGAMRFASCALQGLMPPEKRLAETVPQGGLAFRALSHPKSDFIRLRPACRERPDGARSISQSPHVPPWTLGRLERCRFEFGSWGLEASMNIGALCGAVVVSGLLAVATPSSLSLAQSNGAGVSAPKNDGASAPKKATPSTKTPWKDRYWRHRGGRHPHFGSRRVRS